jgi:glycosyltransferase involved in cell wall biosynthesis
MPSISYAVTACNEHRELSLLLEVLRNNIRQEDEIVVLLDSNATKEIRTIANKYTMHPLNGDFATFKNHLSKFCTKDYIFQIDADEYPHPHLIANLADILQHNQTIDVFLIPRINTVSGLTEEHIQKWRWNVNDKGWVNFPDYQWRIWKNGKGIHWINKVHERLNGFKEYSLLPQSEEYCLFHPKDIERQEKQNALYETI